MCTIETKGIALVDHWKIMSCKYSNTPQDMYKELQTNSKTGGRAKKISLLEVSWYMLFAHNIWLTKESRNNINNKLGYYREPFWHEGL